ncbi:cytochrome c maturation protein CcmE [Alicyclobacillus tolerans]|uniref:cytochrome c maturation protein CcmE n=1 Tax=Alicyclobacillus tolerans TaxID=90970 RepID=UPI001F333260|nr:cytochrome c maturation protein CcmE [Alicyclobacillus tolerans]MCF8563396.1 cytochrome c maturation protein CcmE [Alicyclobacillus tolerans]
MTSTRTKLIVALLVVMGTIGVLIRTAVTHASTFYVTVSELYQEGAQAVHQQTTVSGNLVGSTINYNPDKSLLQFSLQDTAGGRQLPVVFHGTKPDDFSNGWPVIVTGTMNSDGTFEASKLLIKCPSKYSAAKQKTYTAAQ